MQMRRVALINPNTSVATTDAMVGIARTFAPDGMEIVGVTVPSGEPLITEPGALDAAADAVVQLSSSLAEFDAVIVAAFGDPGLARLAAALSCPVVGIGQAAMAEAAEHGRFSVATTTPDLAESIRRMGASYGHRDALAAVRTTPGDASVLMADGAAVESALGALVEEAMQLDGAAAVVIGGGPLGVAARALAPRFAACTIVEPIPAAVRLVTRRLGTPPPSPLASTTTAGAGATHPVAVLLHGFLGDRRDLEPLRCALAPLWPCVSLDLPGHGDTAWLRPPSAEPPSPSLLDGLIDALEALGGGQGGRRYALIGYSLGARLALQAAARRPELVSAVVALGGSPGIADEAARASRLARDAALAARLREMSPPSFGAWLRGEWYTLPLWGNNLAAHPRFGEMVTRRVDGASAAARAAALEASSVGRQPPLHAWLRAPPLPVLFCAGEDDAAYAQVATELRDAAAAVPGGAAPLRVELLRGAAHALLIEAPDAVAAACAAFLREVLPPPPPPTTTTTTTTLAASAGGALRVRGWRLRRFSLPLRAPLALAHGAPLQSRDGCYLVLLADAEGGGSEVGVGAPLCGVGECCPLPGFHREAYADAEAQLVAAADALVGRWLPLSVGALNGALGAWLGTALAASAEAEKLEVARLAPSVRCALEMAIVHVLAAASVGGGGGGGGGGGAASLPRMLAAATAAPAVHSHVRLNGLAAFGELVHKEEEGADAANAPAAPAAPRTLKMKVGGADGAAAGARAARAAAACASRGQRLRLDANQAWGVAQADACFGAMGKAACAALEYVEEPLRAEDAAALPALGARWGVRYALDESLLSWDKDAVDAALCDGACAGVVLKPTLLGGIETSLRLAGAAAARGKLAVLTSAFESGLAHRHLTLLAAALPGGGPSVAHGLSTYERLAADGFAPPFAAHVTADLIDVAAAAAALDDAAAELAVGDCDLQSRE